MIELLVVIGIIGALAVLVLPVLSRSKQKAQGAYCLNNGKQLMVAMTLYAADANDSFPPNPDDGNTVPGHNWCSGQAGQGGSAEFNPDLLKDPERTLLAPYLRGNVSVFHCPGDRRTGKYQGNDPALIGKTVPAARTFSMSQAVGTICQDYDTSTRLRRRPYEHSGKPSLAVNGPWLNSRNFHRRNEPWLTYGSLSAIRAPGPAMLWLLVDEDIRGLNDAAFAFGMEQFGWVDLAANYHNGGCGFAFADGHSENHRWLFRGERKSQSTNKGNPRITDPLDRRDWLWMRERTSAHSSGIMPPPE